MLTAKEAHALASEEYGTIWTLIERAAKQNRFSLDIDTRLDEKLVKYLKDQGYKVEDLSIPRFEETPYGYTNNIIGEIVRIRISW